MNPEPVANSVALPASVPSHEIFNQILTMGNCFGLAPFISPYTVNESLAPFAGDWKFYNPNKPQYRRFGLSLTSLDGGFSGVPDLTSLFEHNRRHGTAYNEMSFRQFTPLYAACPSLAPLIEPLRPFLGRCHFLRFNTGGFFPYHRDSFSYEGDTFRIFVPLHLHAARDFVFLLGRQCLELEAGRPYFINTRMEHAVISFDDASIHLVLNVQLCAESLQVLYSLLQSF